MKYFYGRVSTKEQSLERQKETARGIEGIDRCYFDKQSGKDFNRPEYQLMKSRLVKGDEVYVKELDRLGRDKEGIKSEIEWMRQQGVRLRVLDIPTTMIDFQGQDWIGEMINNILIEVLGSIAEQERKKIKQRQAEGIAAMRVENGKRIGKTGKAYGRPKAEIDIKLLQSCQKRVRDGEMTVKQSCEALGISRSKWYQAERLI